MMWMAQSQLLVTLPIPRLQRFRDFVNLATGALPQAVKFRALGAENLRLQSMPRRIQEEPESLGSRSSCG